MEHQRLIEMQIEILVGSGIESESHQTIEIGHSVSKLCVYSNPLLF